MKPKAIHQEAMDYSFRAKKALNELDFSSAFDFYVKAAELESQVAEFYFDKPELEPTRSVIIRSAAFLNLKAGQISNAQKFIFFGLLNTSDELIKAQLNDALELSVSLKNSSAEAASNEYNYLNLLRQRSVNYILEPISGKFGKSVSLEMIKDFSDNFLKSLKAFAISKLRDIEGLGEKIDDFLKSDFDDFLNPLVTNSNYGSFKFSIANDFLQWPGEDNKEINKIKETIINRYHQEIFINPLTDQDIEAFKNKYSSDEINQIFRPLTRIKANSSTYKVGYYDNDNFNKIFVNRIVNAQRKKLLPVNQITQEDIGELESSIIHKRSSETGKITKKTIIKEQLKAYEFDLKTNQIEPKDFPPVILTEEILLSIFFDSHKGFTFTFKDIDIEYTDVEYQRGFSNFNNELYKRILYLINLEDKEKDEHDFKDWKIIRKLIANTDALK